MSDKNDTNKTKPEIPQAFLDHVIANYKNPAD